MNTKRNRKNELKEKFIALMHEEGIDYHQNPLPWLISHLMEYIGRFSGFAENPKIKMKALLTSDFFLLIEVACDVISDVIKSDYSSRKTQEQWDNIHRIINEMEFNKDKANIAELHTLVNSIYDQVMEMSPPSQQENPPAQP